LSSIPLPGAARDESNLQALRDARSAGDIVAERAALARLLAPYWDWGRSVAYGKLNGVPNRAANADEIAQELIRRLMKPLKKLDFDIPFHALAAKHLGWAIKDHWRAHYREEALPMDPAEVADDLDTEQIVSSVADQAQAFAPYIEDLSERDRQLVIERIFLDMSPGEIAGRHGLSRGAVDTAMHRLLNKLRQSSQLNDVRSQHDITA
jgi:RNA polymerase sigma factor (sigma-70 family)